MKLPTSAKTRASTSPPEEQLRAVRLQTASCAAPEDGQEASELLNSQILFVTRF